MTTWFKSNSSLRAGLTVTALMGLAACASGGKSLEVAGKSAEYREAIDVYTDPGAVPGGLDPVAAAAFWGAEYDRNPADPTIAVNYSAALRKIGSNEQSVNVMAQVIRHHEDNPDVSFEMGKTLIEAGRAFEAVRHLERAAAQRQTDWRVISAFGVALDQIGEHELARTKYDYALTLAPGNVQVLNNKGLSFAMDGKLDNSVAVLRRAASSPGADARVRQNLALSLALAGDLFEAERLARSDLPPQLADQNVDYFRSLVVQPAYWQEFAAGDNVDVPDFDPAPATLSGATAPVTPPTVSTLTVPSEAATPVVDAAPGKPEPGSTAGGVTPSSADAPISLFVAPVSDEADDATDEEVNNEEEENLAPNLKDES